MWSTSTQCRMIHVSLNRFQISTIGLGSACAICPKWWRWFTGAPHSSASYGSAAAYLGACGAINTIPISPLAPVWASHGLLNCNLSSTRGSEHLLPCFRTVAFTRFSLRGGGHQDKQSMPVTDPCQTEGNYGNSVLRDTVSLKTFRLLSDCCCLCTLWAACTCVCVGAWLLSWTSVSFCVPT